MQCISVESLSKIYRLGEIGTGSLAHDLNRLWHRVRGRTDPYLKIGEVNDREVQGDSDYVWALRDVCFSVNAGEVVGIIGRNGAGKSTLLKLLSRVTAPTEGFIRARGRITSLLEVGTGFHPELTGRENIFLNGAILGMRRKEISSKLNDIIGFSGCERYIDTPVKRYSSGMTVRLGFAVAAYLESEILIVDEVLAVGDLEFQNRCLGKMQDISRAGTRTVLFVSHNMGAVSKICNRAILFQNGRLAYDGVVNEAVSMYIDSRVEGRREFEREPDKRFQFLAVSTFGMTGTQTGSFPYDEPIHVVLECSQSDHIPGLEIGVRVLTFDGTIVFTSERSNSDNSPLSPGWTKVRCEIPGTFLAPGRYIINIAAHVPNQEVLAIVESAISIRVEETGSPLAAYAGQNCGFVICPCAWHTER